METCTRIHDILKPKKEPKELKKTKVFFITKTKSKTKSK